MNTAKYFSSLMLSGISLLSPAIVLAGPIWTHVAAACVPDEGSANRYEANAARFRHKGDNTGEIFARCNVLNPLDHSGAISGNPGWDTLEVVYLDPPGEGNQVISELTAVSNVTGGVFALAVFDSNDPQWGPSSDAQRHSVFFTRSFDFGSYAYYVVIKVKRMHTGPVNNPSVSLVRLRSVGFGDDVSTREQ